MMDFLLYFLSLAALTLGTLTVCGLAVRLCSHLFSSLLGRGSGAVFDVTSVIGTPIHELGHAFMCLLFFHPIERIKLWTPNPKNGVYGFVEHRYNRKNLWARLGNLPIAFGPIFSGLAVTVLMLYLCFPTLWNDYLVSSQALIAQGAPAAAWAGEILSLFLGLPGAIAADPLRGVLGLIVILPVSLHVSLSWQDIRSALGALPIFAVLLLAFAAVTKLLGVSHPILQALKLWNLRLLSLFCVLAAFCLLWVGVALLVRAVRALIRCF